jgi:Uma2 family endonuclease
MVAAATLPTLPAKITYEEFLTLPNDGRRYELIDGDLFMFASPSLVHQYLFLELLALFRETVMLTGLGSVWATMDVKFPGDNVVQPDIAVILNDRQSILTGRQIIGAPNIAIEILSLSTRAHDRTTKARLYAENGVPEYWLVDPFTETITVHQLVDGRYVPTASQDIVRSLILPEVRVDARALFAVARTLPD